MSSQGNSQITVAPGTEHHAPAIVRGAPVADTPASAHPATLYQQYQQIRQRNQIQPDQQNQQT